jgi:tetratricopeptide (TPR) repeat protein
MRSLSVFPAGFTADAARQLLGDGDVLQVLEDLVDQSLLKVTDTGSGTRFRMLETVREFSTARQATAGETERVTSSFLAWGRDFGVAHHESLFGADPFPSVERVRAEHDNLVQALRHGLARADGGTVAATSAVLGGLWTVESNYTRMAALAEETAWILSHFRPEPDLVEVTRTALTLCTTYTFLIEGPRAVRSLVALRRLPPAPPSTLARACAIVLGVAPEGPSALHVLCDSDEPLLAGAANGVASYLRENEGDLDSALKAARQMLEAFENRGFSWLWAAAHARISELCLQDEQGDEARRHLRAALPVYEQLGAWSDVVGIRWWMVLANLQIGAVDEAELWLEQAAPGPADEAVSVLTYGLGVRAEILLVRGEVEAGLRLWRRAVDRLKNADDPMIRSVPAGLDPWTLEAKAVAVVAHAHHGRLDLVEEITGELPHALSTMLAHALANPTPFVMELPICGALLLALAAVDLDRAERTGDDRATRSAVRMVALAERLRFLRGFQPTMSPARARHAAEQAARPAYDDAVSSYADLGREDLRAAALAALRAR